MSKFSFFLSTFVILLGSACTKDTQIEPEPQQPTVAPVVTFDFQAKVKNEVLIPDTKKYTNFINDSFTVTKLNYYVSNLKLTRDDGFVYSEPNSYHLMEHVANKTSFKLTDVPEGDYTKIEFLIGVDSLRNVSGAQSGALDPVNTMFWDWEQGYIFFKMEGSYNTETLKEFGDYAIHIGGFSGPNACLQKYSANLATPLSAKNNKQSSVFYNVQVDEIFINPMNIDFTYYYSHISDKTFKDISVNYRDMFVIAKIQN